MSNTVYQDLQKPTFELLGSFYSMPPEVENAYVQSLALYESQLVSAKEIKEVLMGRDSKEAKLAWLTEKSKLLPHSQLAPTKEKYIARMESAPKDMLSSGQLISFLDIVPRRIKDAFLECQASARILALLANPEKVKLGSELYVTDKNNSPVFTEGKVAFARPHLDKPFATPIQKAEHVVALLGAKIDVLDGAGKEFLNGFKYDAVATLKQNAAIIAAHNPEAAAKISAFAATYNQGDKSSLKGAKQVLQQAASDTQLADIYPALHHRLTQIISPVDINAYYLQKGKTR
ncbi:MAG: hypothetical protein IKD08_04220 [Alphaproteobacteria bacterium]|nr:hypothetical protein [Alphaproteobacteria bacterium]